MHACAVACCDSCVFSATSFGRRLDIGCDTARRPREFSVVRRNPGLQPAADSLIRLDRETEHSVE